MMKECSGLGKRAKPRLAEGTSWSFSRFFRVLRFSLLGMAGRTWEKFTSLHSLSERATGQCCRWLAEAGLLRISTGRREWLTLSQLNRPADPDGWDQGSLYRS